MSMSLCPFDLFVNAFPFLKEAFEGLEGKINCNS